MASLENIFLIVIVAVVEVFFAAKSRKRGREPKQSFFCCGSGGDHGGSMGSERYESGCGPGFLTEGSVNFFLPVNVVAKHC